MPSTDDCMIIEDSNSDTGMSYPELCTPGSLEGLKAPPPTHTTPVHHHQPCQEVLYTGSVSDDGNRDDKLVNRSILSPHPSFLK